MDYDKLQKLRKRLYFSVEDAAELLDVKRASARVLCNRNAKKGIFIRIKKDLYVLEQNWKNYSREGFFMISNILQVPSYISLLTALSYFEVTTQVQKDFYENISLKRSVNFNAKGVTFTYSKLNKALYFGFARKDNIFIATKEKAFVDAVYLYSYGKYSLDFSSLDLNKLEKGNLKKIVSKFPQKTKDIVGEKCGI